MKATLRMATEAEMSKNSGNDPYGEERFVIKVGNRKIFTDLGDELITLMDGDVKRIEISDKPFDGSSSFDIEINESGFGCPNGFMLKGKNLEAWACADGLKKLGLSSKKKVYAKLRR